MADLQNKGIIQSYQQRGQLALGLRVTYMTLQNPCLNKRGELQKQVFQLCCLIGLHFTGQNQTNLAPSEGPFEL